MCLDETKLTSHFKLVTVVSSAVPAENSLKSDTFSKQSVKKTSGARHAFGSNSSGLFALAQQIAGGPSRAAGLGPCFWETFCDPEI